MTIDAPPDKWVEKVSRLYPLLQFSLEYLNFTCDGHGLFVVRNGIVQTDQVKNWHEEDDEPPPDDPVLRLRRSLGFPE